MATSTATRPPVEPGRWSTITSVVRNVDLTTDKNRVFDVTRTSGATVTCASAVENPPGPGAIDVLFGYMGVTRRPIEDLRARAEELCTLMHTYKGRSGVDQAQRDSFDALRVNFNNIHELLDQAAAVSHARLTADASLRAAKLARVRQARLHFGRAELGMRAFLDCEDVCRKGVMSAADRETSLNLIATGRTLFRLWVGAFEEGFFI